MLALVHACDWLSSLVSAVVVLDLDIRPHEGLETRRRDAEHKELKSAIMAR